MRGDRSRLALGLLLVGALLPEFAAAQAATGSQDLMTLDKSSLKQEVTSRYTAALALSQDPSVVAADSPRFLWASQAKAQCAIAIGYLRTGIKDPVSVGKCADAYNRMQMQVAPTPPPAAPTPAVACNKAPNIVFFDWNRSDITPDAAATLDNAVAAASHCGNAPVKVLGFTDRSGTETYNKGLSERRASSVRAYFTAHGVPDSAITTQGLGEANPRVPTANGVREPQNRRVEITFE